MAIIFVDSADHYNDGDILTKWDANSGFTVSASGGRCSTAGLSYAGNAGSGLKKNLPSAATYIIGFGLFVPSFAVGDTILASFMENTTKHVDIVILGDGRIRARRAGSTTLGTSTSFLSAGQYNHVEIKITISDTVGVVTVRVNGTSTGWLALTSQDTQNGGSAAITNIIIGGDLVTANNQMPLRFDDIIILDTSGAVNTDLLGDCRVEAIFPNGAGNYSQWTPSAGSNFQNVDDNPPDDDSTYNSSSTTNQIDTFAYGNLSVTSGTVKAVVVNMYARKDESGSRSIAGAARLSSTDAFGAGQLISTSYANYQTVFETDPGAGAWSIADVNSSEFGVKLIA